MKEVFEPMLCPVCGKFYFSPLQEDDIIESLQCAECGWRYDLDQTINHNLKQGRNTCSLNEYKQLYFKKISENPAYEYSEENLQQPEPHLCPVCGKHTFKKRDSFDICPICGWTDDGLMEDEPANWSGCSNDLCLNEFKKRFLMRNGIQSK